MAGLLDTLYLIVAIGVAVIGLAVVIKYVNQSERGESRWVELSSIVFAVLFLLALGIEFMV